MGNLTVVDINPFFGRIRFVRIEKGGDADTGKRIRGAVHDPTAAALRDPERWRHIMEVLTEGIPERWRDIMEVLTEGIVDFPIDVVVIPRLSHNAEMEEGQAKQDAQEQERIDIAASIQKLLMSADKGGRR